MSLKNSLIVLWVYIMYVLGIWLFLSGYLLKRIVVHQNSTDFITSINKIDCANITSLHSLAGSMNHLQDSSFHSKDKYLHRFDKAIIIIIDALRFDFAFNNKKHGDHKEVYENKMPVFKQAMKKNPHNAMLFRLLADPPTTTLQRLKGLTTGSLPTFIDVSLNFAGVEITEDNFIFHMKSHNKNIVFMGDDTWESLFPNFFHRSFPYPSFNVKDLDTVDNGILEHLYEEMENSDSDVIIAHFLGVDHCGHRYGPRHPEMARKLQQMNTVIQNVIEKLKDDTILLVLGDHGMTESGDHGGDSIQEISTALFLYSKTKLTHFAVNAITTVAQVDIVPTLSLLLGLPIPFSNLGSSIAPLFTVNHHASCFDEETDAAIGPALAYTENSMQVQTYLQAYNEISGELSESFLMKNKEKLHNISLLWNRVSNNSTRNKDVFLNISRKYRKFLEDVRNACSEKWATFNVYFIAAGIIVMCFAVLLNILMAEKLSYSHSIIIAISVTLIIVHGSLHTYDVFNPFTWCVFGSVVIGLLLMAFRLCDYNYSTYCVPVLLTAGLVFCYRVLRMNSIETATCFECFSYIFTCVLGVICIKRYTEDYFQILKMALNVSSAITFIIFCMSFSNSFVVHEDSIIQYLLQSMIVYRFLPLFSESLQGYIASNSGKSKTTKKNFKGIARCILPLLCFWCLIIFVRLGSIFYKCREEQIFCDNSDIIIPLEKLHQNQTYKLIRLILSLSAEIFPVLLFLGTASYKYSIKSQTISAVCVKYGTFFMCLLIALRWWLNIVSPNVVDKILKGNEVILTRTAAITCLSLSIIIISFPILAEKSWEMASKEVYCGSFSSLIFVVLQLLYIVAGDALSPAVMLMSFSAILYLVLIQLLPNSYDSPMWSDVVVWSLLTRHWFYATAHQPTFSSIQWDAAFIFNHKEVHSYVLSGGLVLLNTFSSYVFHGLALPLILIVKESSTITSKAVLRLHMKFLLCFGIKLLGTIFASFILRRHLMVWKIFSPKLIYECIGILIMMASTSISHYFMIKVSSQYHKLIRMNRFNLFGSKDQ